MEIQFLARLIAADQGIVVVEALVRDLADHVTVRVVVQGHAHQNGQRPVHGLDPGAVITRDLQPLDQHASAPVLQFPDRPIGQRRQFRGVDVLGPELLRPSAPGRQIGGHIFERTQLLGAQAPDPVGIAGQFGGGPGGFFGNGGLDRVGHDGQHFVSKDERSKFPARHVSGPECRYSTV